MELVSKFGREKEYVRNASKATHMLSSLARCCHRQIRLGKGSPDVQQKGISGNSIFFAQPTAKIPSMELPLPDDALVDSLIVSYTHNIHGVPNAEWALANREECMRIVRAQTQCCPCAAGVTSRADGADSRHPARDMPEHALACPTERARRTYPKSVPDRTAA